MQPASGRVASAPVQYGEMGWPRSGEELIALQVELAAAAPPPFHADEARAIAGCFVCSARGNAGTGARGDPLWAAAACGADVAVTTGEAGGPYEAGALALREGALLETAVRGLSTRADVLLVDATGRDHPRRAGLALHLGAVLDMPTVGVTHRPLVAAGEWPPNARGARSPLLLAGKVVGYWVRTRRGARPLAVHAAWRTNPEQAVEIVLASSRRRTPEPLRRARQAARRARAGAAA